MIGRKTSFRLILSVIILVPLLGHTIFLFTRPITNWTPLSPITIFYYMHTEKYSPKSFVV